MAKSQYTFVKGVLSEDGTTITYLDGEKIEQNIKVADCLAAFKCKAIELSVVTRNVDLENTLD